MNKVKYESLLNCKEGKELDFICDNIEDISIERILEILNSGSLVYVNPNATYEQLRLAIRYFNSDKNMEQKIVQLFLNEYRPEYVDNNAIEKDEPECKVIRIPIDKSLGDKINIFGNKKEMNIFKSIINNNDSSPFMDGYRPQFYFRSPKDYNLENDLKKYIDSYTINMANNTLLDLYKKFENIDVERFIEENTITEDDNDDYRELDIEKTLRKSTFINTLNNAIEFLEALVDDIDENYMFEDDEEKYQELVSKVIFNHLIQLSLGIY